MKTITEVEIVISEAKKFFVSIWAGNRPYGETKFVQIQTEWREVDRFGLENICQAKKERKILQYEPYLFILSPESTWSRDLFIFESIEAQILWKKAKIMALLKQSYLWIHVYFFSKFSGIYLFSHSKHMPIANALDKKSSFLKFSLQIQEILQFFSMKMTDLMLHFWICLLKSD